ncbi:MAG: nicotinate (nicotinamide) nucleotide adenylyltransferase [Gemmatimonadaceae bacterium]|nr:nicotinate (nicotinamide) nucleotide adenylyltransferase [Gemmatimonadaceae bacterium]
MRLGIFGGSFDPPHMGHLLIAHDAMDALSLDRLLIIPAGQQPLKQSTRTPAADRLAMVQRCFAGVARMEVDPVEIARGGLSYMVDTVADVQQRWPSAEVHLLVGSDVLATFSQWREPARLRSMVRLVVLRRLSSDGTPEAPSDLLDAPDAPVIHLATRRVDVSSTEIRARVREGRSIRGFVTDAVAEYIVSTGLYLRDSVAADVSAQG